MDETSLHGRSPYEGPGHETSDINVWAVGKFAIALVGVTVVSLALLFGLMKYFQSRETSEVVQTVEPTKVFPQPQLQSTPIPDLRHFHEDEDKVLNSYGWVDQPKGVVRIPIDRAIDVLAQRGLPARSGGAK
jgi:hypothetical protein